MALLGPLLGALPGFLPGPLLGPLPGPLPGLLFLALSPACPQGEGAPSFDCFARVRFKGSYFPPQGRHQKDNTFLNTTEIIF